MTRAETNLEIEERLHRECHEALEARLDQIMATNAEIKAELARATASYTAECDFSRRVQRNIQAELDAMRAERDELRGRAAAAEALLAEALAEVAKLKGLLPADSVDEFAKRVGAIHAARAKLAAHPTPIPTEPDGASEAKETP